MDQIYGITDKVVLITGAGGPNMGRAAARLFASHGAKVFVTDVLGEGLAETVTEVRRQGGDITSKPADLLDESAIKDVIAGVCGAYGTIHHVLNFAACYDPRVGTLECETADWDRIVGVILKGTWLVSKHAMTVIKSNPTIGDKDWRGSVLTVGSTIAHRGTNDYLAYTAAKSGILGLTRAMALDGAPLGIRVNCLSPGLTRTPATPVEKGSKQERDLVALCHPFPQMCEPEDMAATALWLSSDAARCMTGAVVTVDCGWTAKL